MTQQTEWFGTREAARRLGMSKSTLYKLLDDGTIQSLRIGRGVHKFNEEMIARILAPSKSQMCRKAMRDDQVE